MPIFAFRRTALPAALLLLGLTHPVKANPPLGMTHSVAARNSSGFFPKDATINYDAGDCAIIGCTDLKPDYFKRYSSPTVSLVSGGRIRDGLIAFSGSKLNIRGGSIGCSVEAYASTTIAISGGSIGEDLTARGRSAIHISSGRISGGLMAEEDSKVTVTGGTVGNRIGVCDSSVVNVRGGHIKEGFCVGGLGTLNLFGKRLRKTLVHAHLPGRPSNREVFWMTGKNDGTTDSQYILHGKLCDGTSVNGLSLYIENGHYVKVNLINIRRSRTSQHRSTQ